MDSKPAVDQAELFGRIRHWKAFLPETQHILPSEGSLRWFIRCHEQALVSAGAVLKLPRGTYIDPEPFKALCLRLMQDVLPGGSAA